MLQPKLEVVPPPLYRSPKARTAFKTQVLPEKFATFAGGSNIGRFSQFDRAGVSPAADISPPEKSGFTQPGQS